MTGKKLIRNFCFLFFLVSAFPISLFASAPTFDNLTRGTATSSDTVSVNHDVGGGCSNTIIPASLVYYDIAVTVSSFTIGGSAATAIDSITAGASRVLVMRYRLGQSGTVTVAATLSASTDILSIAAPSYCGVHQSTPLGTAVKDARGTGSGDPPSIVVTSATNELVVEATMAKEASNTLTVGGGQTERLNGTTSGYAIHAASDEAGAASVTMSWSQTEDDFWGMIGVPLKPVSTTRHRVVLIQ